MTGTGTDRKAAREERLRKSAARLRSTLVRLGARGHIDEEAILAEIQALVVVERDEVGKLFDSDLDEEIRATREHGALGMRQRAAREAESWNVAIGETAYNIGNAIRALPVEAAKKGGSNGLRIEESG